MGRRATGHLCAAALSGLLCCGPALAQIDRAAFVSLGASVLKVEVIKQSGGYSLGSGVVVGQNLVVTNCHVTREAREVRVIKAGTRWPAAAQSVDAERDLCLLRVPGITTDAVPLGAADRLAVGQKVFALGYTGGTGLSNSPGAVVTLHRHDGSRVIQSSNWFNSGASGGGLFDERLRLVGILTFRLRGGSAHYFAAPVEWVRERLDDEQRFARIQPIASQRLAYWQRSLDEQPNFLKASVFEQGGDWPALEALAKRWMAEDASDFEPWHLHGLALQEQWRYEEARASLEKAVALEAAFAPAWFRLGVVCHRLGARGCAARALEAMKPLDGDLAERLAKLLVTD